jgi:hypothetical protein
MCPECPNLRVCAMTEELPAFDVSIRSLKVGAVGRVRH